jgi:L-ascorbate metabolism protein UlaG (beta-lactamase superfamily)
MKNNINVTYFDTAMVLIEVNGVRLLTDPVLDPAGSAFDYGPVHLEKTSPAAVTVEQLGQIDAVLLSHDQHGDNLDNAGRELLSSVPRILTTPLGASRLEDNAEGLSHWQSVTVEGLAGGSVTITAVPAQHGPEGTLEATGPVTGFIITTNDRKTIYVSGDTILFAGTEEIASRYAPIDLAILHVSVARVEPMGNLKVSLSAEEAVGYAQSLGARKVLPIHFKGWAHFSQGRDEATKVFTASEIAEQLVLLRSGEIAAID